MVNAPTEPTSAPQLDPKAAKDAKALEDGKGCLMALLGGALVILALATLTSGLWIAATVFVAGAVCLLPGRTTGWFAKQGVNRRGRGGLALFALFAGLIVIAATFEETPEMKADQERAAANEVRAGEAAKQLKAKAAAGEAARIKVATRTALLERYRQMLEAARPCDAGFKAATGQIGSLRTNADIIDAYATAQSAQAKCDEAHQTISSIGKMPPTASGEAEAAVAKAVELCGNVYFARWRALGSLMTVLDGDTKASQMVETRDALQLADKGVVVCVAEWFTAANRAGVDLSEMSAKKD